MIQLIRSPVDFCDRALGQIGPQAGRVAEDLQDPLDGVCLMAAWVHEEDHVVCVDAALVPNRRVSNPSDDPALLSLAEQAAEHLHAQDEEQRRE